MARLAGDKTNPRTNLDKLRPFIGSGAASIIRGGMSEHAIDGPYHAALDTANFTTLLSALDTDVQKALNTLDKHHDRIYKYGSTVTTYAKSAANLTAALAAASSGELVWFPPGTYAADYTIPDGVIVSGADRNASIITGQVTFAGNGYLSNCAIVIAANDANDYAGITAPDVVDNTGYINQLFILVNNTGAGHGYGILVWGRAGNIEGDYCPYIWGSTQDVLF